MPRLTNKKFVIGVAVAAAIVAVGGGTALAYWTTTGNGTGSATTGTSSNFVVTSDAAVGNPLTPGGPTDTITFHVKNTNSGVQHLNAVAVTVANNDGTTWTAVSGCSASDYTIGTPVFTAGDIASGTTVNGTVTITMNNLGTPQDGCKNAAVPLYIVAS
ncbi:MAG TPA: hypothetical protein VNU19_19860 [Candidatus Acidoferrum sp.]|jgi:hypothetical protein|nr:hypothetical protein [Candidatus Acidoferrum sp.]